MQRAFSESVNSGNFAKQNTSESVNSEKGKPLQITAAEVDTIAYYLVEKFHHQDGLRFYQKVAWYVPRGSIDRLVAIAFEKGRSPARYFSKMAKHEGGF